MQTLKEEKEWHFNSMHGRQRRLTEKTEEEIKMEQEKAMKLKRAGMAVLLKIREKDYSPEAFALTGVLARLNPDFYTIWNYRKEYLMTHLSNDEETHEDKVNMVRKEVSLTEEIIREKDPKCYGLWHHRRWLFDKYVSLPFQVGLVICRCPELLTDHEIELCERLLQADQRNFHCWNHWMLITRKLGLSTEELMAFTWRRIADNSSNYSAWHFRGELLKRLIEEKYSNDVEGILSLLQSELEVNLNALYTECDDQSSWYYMRTLFYIVMDMVEKNVLSREVALSLFDSRLAELEELIDFAPDCIYGAKFVEELKEFKLRLN